MAKLKTLGDKSHAVDVQIAAGMTCMALINDQGVQAIQKVIQGANDPAQALAHVIYMALGKVKQALHMKGIEIDDRVWIAGGGVLDRVIFELMIFLATGLKMPQAQDSNFVHQVKAAVLDLMEDDDKNSESIKTLHDKGLPMPKQAPDGDNPQEEQQEQQGPPQVGPPQGLAAPQPPNGGMQ